MTQTRTITVSLPEEFAALLLLMRLTEARSKSEVIVRRLSLSWRGRAVTLSEALPIVREACQRVLEADKKATKGPWVVDDHLHIGKDGGKHGYRELSGPGLFWIARVQGFNRGDGLVEFESNAELIALSRNLSPGMARLLLAFMRHVYPAWNVLKADYSEQFCAHCSNARAIIAFAEEIQSLQSGQSRAVGRVKALYSICGRGKASAQHR